MPRFVALLRGINVGGNRIIKMEKLREIFTGAGAKDVATYIQSGNVAFSHARPTSPRFERAIEEATGFAIPVILRSAAEMQVLAHPFPDDAHVHVMFAAAPFANVAIVAMKPEAYVISGRDLYLYTPNGVGNSKLAVALGKLPVTARNWRTVQQLHAMAIQSVK